jgi:hypothetical protein
LQDELRFELNPGVVKLARPFQNRAVVFKLLVEIRVGDAAGDSVLKLPFATFCQSAFKLWAAEPVDEFFAKRQRCGDK